jgi:hypothetical protein
MKRFGKVAVLAGVATLAFVPADAIATKQKPSPKDPCKTNPKKCPKAVQGRMTGHGHFISPTYGKVQWEFRNSICNANRFPDLKVEWGRNKFRLTSYSSPLTCVDTPVSEGQPRAGFDTIIGQGAGTLNGKPATASFTFTDAGEPGRNDFGSVRIMDANGVEVLKFTDEKAGAGGNHQAHRVTGSAAR